METRLFPEEACPSKKGDNEMRELIENVSLLQKQLNELQLENQLLKNILDRSGISVLGKAGCVRQKVCQ